MKNQAFDIIENCDLANASGGGRLEESPAYLAAQRAAQARFNADPDLQRRVARDQLIRQLRRL